MSTFFPPLNTTAQNLQIMASFVIPIIGVVAAIVAWRAILAQRDSNARRIYFDYVRVAFDNPEFAYPPSSTKKFDHENGEIDGDKTGYEKYEWFLSLLVVSVEGILEIAGRNSVWRKTALMQLEYHKEYFAQNLEKPWIVTMSKTHVQLPSVLKAGANA